jgi:hypothetical protein
MLQGMKRIISISEVVESRAAPQGTLEVLATAEADYDEAKALLLVELDSFAKIADRRGHDERVAQAGLPAKQTVRETVGPEDAVSAAKDIFHRWAGRVRQAMPTVSDEEAKN